MLVQKCGVCLNNDEYNLETRFELILNSLDCKQSLARLIKSFYWASEILKQDKIVFLNKEYKPYFWDLSILVVSPTLLLMVGFDVTLKVLHRHMFALGKHIDPLPHSTGNPQQN